MTFDDHYCCIQYCSLIETLNFTENSWKEVRLRLMLQDLTNHNVPRQWVGANGSHIALRGSILELGAGRALKF